MLWPVRIAAARLRPYSAATTAKLLIVASIVALFLAGDAIVFRKLFRAAAAIESATPFFAAGIIENFLELVLLVAVVVLFFSSLTSAIGAFFVDLDLDLHHSAPRRKSAILVSRWLKTFSQSAYVVVLFLAPLFFAYAAQFHVPLSATIVAFGAFVLLLTVPVSLASLAVILLVRYFPLKRVEQIAATLAVLFTTVVIVAVRVARPERLFSDVDTDDVASVLRQLSLPGAGRYPTSWLASIIVSGSVSDSVPEIVRIACAAALAFALFLLLARPLYFKAWVRARESQAPVAPGASLMTRVVDFATSRLHAPTRALVRKEMRILLRDSAQWSQLMMMIALLFLYFYNIQMMPLEGDARAVLLAYLNLGMAGFVVAAISLRFAYPSLSAEAKAFWIVESSPVSYRRLLWVKVAVYALPLLALTLLLVGAGNVLLAAPSEVWVATSIGAMLLSVTLVGLGVGMGALAPDFSRENAMEVALSLGGFAYMAIALGYTGVVMALLARPAQRVLLHFLRPGADFDSWVTPVTPVAVALAVSIFLLIVPVEAAQRRLTVRRRH